MSKITVFSSFSFCLFVFTACVKDQGKLIVSQAASVSACDTITYTKHIKPIIDSACIVCHGTTPLPGAPPLTSYSEVVSQASLIKSTVFDGVPEPMPQTGSITQSQKDKILCWLNNGKKE